MSTEVDMKKQALDMGWIPPERYKGDPEKFIEAEDFVERGKNFLPILKKNNEKLIGQMSEIRGELSQTKVALGDAINALNEFKRFHEESSKNAFERARQSLLLQKRDAMKEEDFDKVTQIEDTIHQMDRQMVEAEKKEEAEKGKRKEKREGEGGEGKIDPVMQHWMTENTWYGADKKKTAYANAIAPALREEYPSVIGLDFLNLLRDEVEERFNGGGKKEKTVDEEDDSNSGGKREKVGSGRNSTSYGEKRGKKLTYADLDGEARKVCDRYETQLVGPNKAYKTVDEWRKVYCESLEGGV